MFWERELRAVAVVEKENISQNVTFSKYVNFRLKDKTENEIRLVFTGHFFFVIPPTTPRIPGISTWKLQK